VGQKDVSHWGWGLSAFSADSDSVSNAVWFGGVGKFRTDVNQAGVSGWITAYKTRRCRRRIEVAPRTKERFDKEVDTGTADAQKHAQENKLLAEFYSKKKTQLPWRYYGDNGDGGVPGRPRTHQGHVQCRSGTLHCSTPMPLRRKTW